MRTLLGISVAVALAVALAYACSSANVGTPCEFTQGKPFCKTNVAERNVASDCDEYWCLSYQGSRPYCSMECNPDEGCPEGFRCIAWATVDVSLKGSHFCIPKSKEPCANDNDCNPDCSEGAKCTRDYFCGEDKYCTLKSCQQQETDAGTPEETDAGNGGDE
jgi:hypothetical protein